jgi:site-specific DNA-cytosine methylase
MKILELFAGTHSFSKVAEARGHKCFTIDILEKFKPDLCKDVLELKKGDIPFIPDVIWASPPCTEYSHAKRRGVRNIEGANKIVLKTLQLIKELNPKVWIIENPQTGLLKNQKFIKEIPFEDASYCKYGLPYRKQTRFWNNANLKLKTCNKDCKFMDGGKHIGSAGNGRKKYTDKNYKREDKYKVPEELCFSIIKQVEDALTAD